MLPRHVISYGQLLAEGHTKRDISAMTASLRLFPTPFKGIYYAPLEQERKAWFIEKPLTVVLMALEVLLASKKFYFSCDTAEEALGLKWTPSGRIHIVNERYSGFIDLAERIGRNRNKRTYRAGKIAQLLSFYGNRIIFHKVKPGWVERAKLRQTPYGRFALRSQIKIDRKRFRE